VPVRSPYVGLNGIRSAFYLSQPPESQVLVDGAAVAATAAHAQRHLTAALATSYRSRACQPCPRRPLHSASGCDAGAASYYESSTSLNVRASLASFSAASVAANLAITAAITSLSLSVVPAAGAALVAAGPAASA